jgi:RHS repeat-associated protein
MMARKHWIRSWSSGKPRRKGRSWQPAIEVLEGRILPATVNWSNPSGGYWNVAANWSTNTVPGSGDDVSIITASPAMITIPLGDNVQVQSVTTASTDTLSITGGSLGVTVGGSMLHGPLAMTGGALIASGTAVTLIADGNSTISGASLFAQNGAELSLPQMTSYVAAATAFEANGSGSLLDVSALTMLTQQGYWGVNASSGGTVNLSGMTSLNATNGTIYLQDSGGSTLLDSNVTTLNGVNASLDGTDQQVTNSWTKFTGGSLNVTAGSYTLPGLTDLDESNVNVSGGGKLSLPGLTSYLANDSVLQAYGSGSLLDVSALTTLTQQGYWTVSASSGGTVNLSGMTSLNATNGTIYLQDSGNSTLLDSNVTTLSGVNASLDGTDQQVTDSWTQFTGGSLNVTAGSYTLPGLTDLDESNVNVSGGGRLSLPGLTSYLAGANVLQAYGSGSLLDVSALTTLTQQGYWGVNASSGGTVNLSGMTSLNATNGTIYLQDSGNSTLQDGNVITLRGVSASLDGTDQQVTDSWTQFTGGTLNVTGGTVTLPNLIDIADSSLRLISGGALILPVLTEGNITISNGMSVTIQGTVVSLPAAGTSDARVNVPQTQGLSVFLQNSGVLTSTMINVGQGTTVMLPGGTYNGDTTFNVAEGATVDLTGGYATTYGGMLTGSGTGIVQLSGGGVAPALGGLTLNFAGSMFQWTGGVLNTALGNLTNLGTLNLAGNTEKLVYSDGTLDNFGTIIQTGSGNLGLHSDNVTATTLKIEPGASYLIESDAGIDNFAGGQTALSNAGIIRKTTGSGTSTLYIPGAMSNIGTIEADSGTLYLDATSLGPISGSTLTSGTWKALGGATLALPTGTAITSNQANITLGGAGATITGLGGLASNSGALTLTGGANFTTAGDFSNTGNLSAGSGSALMVNGNFTQSAAGTLNVQLGGTPASGQFGQVVIRGTAALAGAFDLALVNGFSPTAGQQFRVMTYASVTGSFTSFSGLSPFFTESEGPTALDLDAATSAVDLAATSVTANTTVTAGQPITVNWQVIDQSGQAATGSWQDSVYLSTTQAITSGSILLGSVSHSGGLGAGGSYNASWTGALPAVAPGYYDVLVQADSLYQVPDPNRANDILAVSTGQLDVTVPTLTLGTPVSDSFTAADQDRYYQVSVPAGGTLQVALTSSAASGAVALYVRQGTPPTPYSYQAAADVASQPNQTVSVPQIATAGSYYILAHSISGAAANASYTLIATQTNVLTVSTPPTPQMGGNGGNVTISIGGTNFSRNTTAILTRGSTTIQAASIYYQSPSQIYATFNLNGAATGAYTVTVQDGSQTATARGTFQVVPATTGNPVQLVLTPPALVSAGRDSIVYVTATNTSNNDILAPLLQLTADGATLKLPSQTTFQGPSLYLMATSPTGPAGTLTPGESVQVEIQFQSITTTPTINFQLNYADDSQPMDWASQQATLQLPSISNAAWPIVYANVVANMGSTVASYHAALATDATYLAQFGEPTNDVLQLVAFEIQKADAAYTAQSLVTVAADSLPAPGMDLTFEQSYLQSISGRYYQGILGQGWTTNWDVSASTVAGGNAVIKMSGSDFFFVKQPNGSYDPEAGEQGIALTFSNGAYQLVERDGTVYQFNTNGTLDYVQDTHGNRITTSYDAAGRLSQLTETNGEYLHLAYNSQGQLGTLTDSAGQTENYGYTGGMLTSYTDVYGTTTYTYVSDGTAAQNGALAQIAYADNTHIYFTYDAQGRLIDQHRDGGGEDETFTYLTPGGYTVTNGVGHTTTTYFDRYGGTVETIDGNGNATFYKYDGNLNLVEADGPAGIKYLYTYDAKGNLLSETDPLNLTTLFTYNGNNDLTGYTDARGDTTSYAYNSANDLLSITYANGTVQQYSYNPLGEATQFLNARGHAIGYAYNAQGLVNQETFADGSTYSFTYDARGNMLTATDSDGTITFSYTDPRNLSFLTTVSYPDGTFLEFTYNVVGQRTESVDQTGFTVNYSYDALGRLAKLTEGSGNLIVQYTYDAAGNLIQKDNGNGTRTEYTFDAAGNVLSITNLRPDHVTVNSFDDYTYDARGNVLTDTNQDGRWIYGYDADSQLTTAVFTPNSTDLDGLTAQDLQYVYDAAGNRISQTVNGVVTTYVANNVNEYTLSTTAGIGTTTYQYDADANLIGQTDASGNNTTYRFNALNQLSGVSGPGLTASYTYNPLGEMISQRVNGVTTNYQIDPAGLGNVVAAFSGGGVYNNSGGLTAHYTYGRGLVSQVVTGGPANYYDFNIVGSTIGISGASGSYINKYAYAPFGLTITGSVTVGNPFTFVGQFGVMNSGSGFLRMLARNYDPQTAQFLSPDPLGLAGGQSNLRCYVRNSPVAIADPTGLQAGVDFQNELVRFGCHYGLHAIGILTAELLGLAYLAPADGWLLGLVLLADVGLILWADYPLLQSAVNLGWNSFLNKLNSETGGAFSGILGPPNDPSGADDGGCPCHCPPPNPPQTPNKPGPPGNAPNHNPVDPNSLIGPAGFGAQNFIQPTGTWSYTVDFENDGNAAALNVSVTEQLDPNLDWSTFQLGSFGFGPINVTVPVGLTQYQTTVAYQNTDGAPLNVQVSVDFNVQTGLLTVTFTSLDPATGQAPTGVFDGFLPPDDNSHVGEGYVQYTVKPKTGLSTGTTINQQASVVFDINAPISTNTISNTVADVVAQTTLSEPAGTTTPTAEKISTLLGSHYIDPDGSKNTRPGIAVIGTTGTGTWQYSINGKTWATISAVSTTSALLLPQGDMVRLLPAGLSAGLAELLYVAWDGSAGTAGQHGNAGTVGGGTPFSTQAGLLDVTLTAVTRAPVWLASTATLAPVLPGDTNPAGQTVAQAFGSVFSGDQNQNAGVAVTGMTGTVSGIWQYQLAGGGGWQKFPKVSASTALLLGPDDLIRFIPKSGFTGLVTLQVHAWDGGGSFAAGGTVNLRNTGTGGKTYSSSAVLTGKLYVNKAPAQIPPAGGITLPSIAENAPTRPVSVATLLKNAVATDVDKDPLGMALTAVNGPGTWQYELPGGAWQNVPAALSDASALLLPSTAWLRFDPTTNQSGSATLTWDAWDGTEGTNGQDGFAIGLTGGATAFSTSSATVTLTISPSQHAPAWSGSGAALTPVLPANSNPAGDTVASVFGSFFAGPSATTVGIAVSGVSGTKNGDWQYSTDGGKSWNSLATASATQARLLLGTDRIRFLPNGKFLATVRLTAHAWDGSGFTAGGTANLTINGSGGGTSHFSSTTLSATCLINDAPTLNN